MDLNPLFTSATAFRPGGAGGELQLFQQAGIQLVHGWLADPDSQEAEALAKTPDYDSAVTLIADADHITQGNLVVSEKAKQASRSANGSAQRHWTVEEQEKVARGTCNNLSTPPC
jgi:hypothetical protein